MKTSFQDLEIKQCCKLLSPRCPRRSGLGLGDLLSDAGSTDGRPEMTISQILWPLDLHCKGSFGPIKSITFWVFQSLTSKIVILCLPGPQIFTQGYPVLESGRPQDYFQIITSLQHWIKFVHFLYMDRNYQSLKGAVVMTLCQNEADVKCQMDIDFQISLTELALFSLQKWPVLGALSHLTSASLWQRVASTAPFNTWQKRLHMKAFLFFAGIYVFILCLI